MVGFKTGEDPFDHGLTTLNYQIQIKNSSAARALGLRIPFSTPRYMIVWL